MDIWNNEDVLEQLEVVRTVKRKGSGRLTFDCVNTVVRGDRVYCSRGKKLGQARDGSLSLLVVLRGITSGICSNCSEFSCEEE